MNTLKRQCWEFKKCGRELGGPMVEELGVCPAATDAMYHGKNGGTNAGRYCWKVAGTLCGGVVQGSFATKFRACGECDFYREVRLQEGAAFEM